MRPSIGATTACAAVQDRPPARAASAPGARVRAPGSAVARSRRFRGAAPRPRRTAQSSSPAAVSPPCSLPSASDEAQGRQLEVLGVVDEHVAPARGDPRAHVGLVAQEGDGAQERGRRSRARPARAASGRGSRRGRRTRARARRAGRPAGRAAAQRATSSAVTIASLRRSMRAMTDASRVAGLPWKSWTWSVSSSTRSSSIASRSAGATGTTKGSSPASSASSRSRRAAKPCTVWTASSSKPRSSSSSTPVRSASAAASEAVRARTCSGASPPAEASHAWRASSARVLPVPAAPTTSSGPPRCAATSRCAGVRPSSGSGTPLGYGRARSCSPQLP